MSTTLIALHGFTQNGALMKAALEPLASRLPAGLQLECPDGPNACAEASVDRMHQILGGARQAPPYLCWFDATDDGREYRGFEATKQRLGELIAARGGRTGLLGFSQGAICAASLAALSVHGRFPRIDFVILVAGRVPRADEVGPLLEAPLPMPSLHIRGQRDPIAKGHVEALAERFDAGQRELVLWAGPHVVPTRGEGADAIVRFIERQA